MIIILMIKNNSSWCWFQQGLVYILQLISTIIILHEKKNYKIVNCDFYIFWNTRKVVGATKKVFNEHWMVNEL